MKKKAYPKKTVYRHLKNDLGLDEDVTIEFWANPSRAVCMNIMLVLGAAFDAESKKRIEGLADLEKMFYESISELIVDTDIEGVSFDTPESTMKAFEHPGIPWHVFTDAIIVYISELTNKYEPLKKVLSLYSSESTSGQETKETDKS